MRFNRVLIASLVAGLAGSVPSAAAWAQADGFRPPAGSEIPAPARIAPLRVESSISLNVPRAAGADAEDRIKQIEAARVALYQAAARECDNLRQVFKTDCRLQNVRVASNVQSRGGNGETMFVTVTSSYDLTYRPN